MTYGNNAFLLPSTHSSLSDKVCFQQLHSQLFLCHKYFARFLYHSCLHPASYFWPIPNTIVLFLFHYPNGRSYSREISSPAYCLLLVSGCPVAALTGAASASSPCFTALLPSAPALAGSVLLVVYRVIPHFLSCVFLPPSKVLIFPSHGFTNGRI